MATSDERADVIPDDLDPLIAQVVSGPLDEFVARRDALVRDLKAAGRTEESAAVKRLRKPSRLAWALDGAVAAGDSVERVAAAVHDVVEAQEGTGDMRSATRDLRDTVGAAATAAAGAAKAAGVSVDRADLVPALMAVVGDAAAFDRLRKGQLAEIPVAGGFDALAPLTTAPRLSGSADDGADATVTQLRPADRDAVSRAQAEVSEAEAAAASARDRADAAERAVEDATGQLEAAERALHDAEVAAREASDLVRTTKREAKAARDAARTTERAAAMARGKLQRLEG